MSKRTARMAARLSAVLVAGLLPASLLGLAPASASAKPTRELYEAGYHFRAPRAAMTLQSTIKIPRSTCGRNTFVYSPQVVIRYHIGTGVKVASVQLALGCAFGIMTNGDAVLQVNGHDKVIPHPLRPGQSVTVVVSVTRSRAITKIIYSKHSSASLSGHGGRARDGRYTVALPKPPRYGPVRFSGCRVNGRKLGSLRPGAWNAINKAGKITGRVSRLSHGTAFTVSR